MFRKLCGESTLRNVVIVTNMWRGVDPQIGEEREAELKGRDIFFKPALENGAQMTRHGDTTNSAEGILRLILRNHPLPLRIQVELVDEGKELSETSAGMELSRDLNEKLRRHKEEMRALGEEMRQAVKGKDEEARKELEEEVKWMRCQIARVENEAERLTSDYQKEVQKLGEYLEAIEKAKQEADYAATQHGEAINKLNDTIQAATAAAERERAELRGELGRHRFFLALAVLIMTGAFISAIYNQ